MKKYYLINEDFFDAVDSEMMSSSGLDNVEDIKKNKKYDYDCVMFSVDK